MPRGARLPQGRIKTLLRDRGGALWIGSAAGLSRRAAGGRAQAVTATGLVHGYLRARATVPRAAASFSEAQRKSNNNGLKIMPPPMPIIPESTPMADPVTMPTPRFSFFEEFSFKTTTIRITANNKQAPKICL